MGPGREIRASRVVSAADPPQRMVGVAEVGRRTRAFVRWKLTESAGDTELRLEATVDRVGPGVGVHLARDRVAYDGVTPAGVAGGRLPATAFAHEQSRWEHRSTRLPVVRSVSDSCPADDASSRKESGSI